MKENNRHLEKRVGITDDRIIKTLQEERAELLHIINESEKGIREAPPGSVQVKKHKKGLQFFHRLNPHEKNGTYMPASDKNKAYALVQKRYLMRLHKAAEVQLKVIDSFLKGYHPNSVKEVFMSESENRKKIIDPLVVPDSLFLAAWQNAEYDKKPFYKDAAVHYTQKNERVRSKSEVLIANELDAAGIPYKYECPLKIGNMIIYPDFTVLDIRKRREVYWEHLGMMDDSDYCNNALTRIRTYEANGIIPGDNLILTAETSKIPITLKTIKKTINCNFIR